MLSLMFPLRNSRISIQIQRENAVQADGSHPMPKCEKSSQNLHNQQIKRTYNGGHEGDRTLDLTDANRTLSQLSYAPEY